MARKYFRAETVPSSAAITTRLGAQGAPYKDTEVGKLVKASGDSGHVLAVAGDQIDGQIVGVESATADGFGIGSVNRKDVIVCYADGLQATPGVGNIAVGDQVVVGTVAAKDTAMTGPNGTGVGMGRPKVAKATLQVDSSAPADLTAAGARIGALASGNLWRVVSLLGGAGAPGQEIAIERVYNFA